VKSKGKCLGRDVPASSLWGLGAEPPNIFQIDGCVNRISGCNFFELQNTQQRTVKFKVTV